MGTNSNIDLPTEQPQSFQDTKKKNLFEKFEKAEKKESVVENKVNVFFAKLGKGFYILRCICCFTALLSTVATIITILDIEGAMAAADVLVIIGLISALLACPVRLISTVFSIAAAGFSIGLGFLGVGCVVGLAIGLLIGGFLVLCFPAVITIKYFFNELIYMKP